MEFVRDELALKGTRMGCLTGDCGACTVFLDGAVVKACLALAGSADGSEVVTIEGAAKPSASRRTLQHHFVAQNGFQCGFCTTGMLLTAVELLRDNGNPRDEEIRPAISGNLCRCTGYDDIVAAIRAAAEALNGGSAAPALEREPVRALPGRGSLLP